MNRYFVGLAADKAIEGLKTGEYTLAVVSGVGAVTTYLGSGVNSLIQLYENSPAVLKNAIIFDKVIGSAAAHLCVLAGVKAVYGMVLSKAGQDVLVKNNIPFNYGLITERILNRSGDDYCPIEKASLNARDASEAYTLIKERQKELAKR